VCVGLHHCWDAGSLGLGLSPYIYVPHILSIQQFIVQHGIRGLGFLLPPPQPPPPPCSGPAVAPGGAKTNPRGATLLPISHRLLPSLSPVAASSLPSGRRCSRRLTTPRACDPAAPAPLSSADDRTCATAHRHQPEPLLPAP
jgi:hypothetical protein